MNLHEFKKNFIGRMHFDSPNAVYLRGNCQLHSGFSYDKKSRVSVSNETQNFKTNSFWYFHLWKKCLSYNL